MSLALMLVLQAAVPPPARPAPPPPPPLVVPIDFDLARYRPGDFGAANRACRNGDAAAIVVCGRRTSAGAYPLDEMAAIFEPRPFVAEIGLVGNLRAGAFVEAVELAPGVVSNRFLVGIRLPF
jgi:hypothetical protein